MNKNAQILLGVGILGVGGYLYWKSTQKEEPKQMVGMHGRRMVGMASATGHKRNVMGGARKKKFELPKWLKRAKNADGSTIFANANGIFVDSPKGNVFANAEGIFADGASGKIFANADGINEDGTANALPKNFFNKQGSGWIRGADGKVFANMVQPFGTSNCGHTGEWNC